MKKISEKMAELAAHNRRRFLEAFGVSEPAAASIPAPAAATPPAVVVPCQPVYSRTVILTSQQAILEVLRGHQLNENHIRMMDQQPQEELLDKLITLAYLAGVSRDDLPPMSMRGMVSEATQTTQRVVATINVATTGTTMTLPPDPTRNIAQMADLVRSRLALLDQGVQELKGTLGWLTMGTIGFAVRHISCPGQPGKLYF